MGAWAAWWSISPAAGLGSILLSLVGGRLQGANGRGVIPPLTGRSMGCVIKLFPNPRPSSNPGIDVPGSPGSLHWSSSLCRYSLSLSSPNPEVN